MTTVQIDTDFRISLPESVRGTLRVGDQVAVTQDIQGRIVIMSAEQVIERLNATFGLWAD